MQHLVRLSAVVAAAVLAGCASTANLPPSAGKHLVYRDTAGNVIRQFDYPDDAFCRKVEAVAGRGARCQEVPAGGMQARATLRYNPPGVLVEGHYADLARCQQDTSVMSPGVQLVNACAVR